MNLQKITGTIFSCVCNHCKTILHHPTVEIYANLDDKAYISFYCSKCKSLDLLTHKLAPGTQIIYVPMHADGILHPDAELGFVTSNAGGKNVFCRYWSKSHDGLRTLANSEATPVENLVIKDTREQDVVDELMKELYPPEEEKAK